MDECMHVSCPFLHSIRPCLLLLSANRDLQHLLFVPVCKPHCWPISCHHRCVRGEPSMPRFLIEIKCWDFVNFIWGPSRQGQGTLPKSSRIAVHPRAFSVVCKMLLSLVKSELILHQLRREPSLKITAKKSLPYKALLKLQFCMVPMVVGGHVRVICNSQFQLLMNSRWNLQLNKYFRAI